MVFGTNLIKSAMVLIPSQTIKYRKFLSKSVSDFGESTMSYSDWSSVKGSQQPGIVSSFGGKCIEMKDYKDMGLDWSRRYITVWIPDVGMENTVERNGCDQIKIGSRVFNVLQVENWLEYDGWIRTYCVEQKDASDESSS